MQGWQVFVFVAEVILAKLPGRIAERLERSGNCARLFRHSDVGAGLTDGCQPSSQRKFASDEIRAPCCATRFRIVVGKDHPFGRKLVEARRFAGHHAAMIGADIEPADVIAHDDENIRLA